MFLNDTKEEMAFDLDNNRPFEGNCYVVPKRLVEIIVNLRKNGFNVINGFVPDLYIILKNSMVETSKTDIDAIKQDGIKENEFRKVVSITDGKAYYDCYIPQRELHLDFSKDTVFPFLPSGFSLIEMEDRYRLQTTLELEEGNLSSWYDERPNGIFVKNPSDKISELKEWAEKIIGKDLEPFKYHSKDSYGNSSVIVDESTNEEVESSYMFCDSLMVPVIMELREKGYKTLGCCSGHYNNIFIQDTGIFPLDKNLRDISTWIVFSTETPLPFLPEGLKDDEEDYPDGYVSPMKRVGIDISIRKENGLFKSSEELKEELLLANQRMLIWAQSLPMAQKQTL